jgi:hypothetical protein
MEFESRQGLFFLPFTNTTTPARGPTQLPVHWVLWDVFSSIKGPGREADHSALSSAEVKNEWSYEKSVKMKNSHGYDGISTKVLKLILPYISSPLT